jgi:PAT family beta-lactamase induction signal transducer AmpG
MSTGKKIAPPALWVPTSYFAEGIPFAMVIWVAGTMFKDLGLSDGKITLSTASIGLAWSLKPFWAAFLDAYRSKKFFVLAMEVVMATLIVAISLSLPLPNYFQIVIAILWVLAFASATQDICVDGVYITSLDKPQQAAWIGVQGMFWNVGRIFATAAIVGVAGILKNSGRSQLAAWASALVVCAVGLGLLAAYHYFILPPGSPARKPNQSRENVPSSPVLRGGVGLGVGALIGGGVAITAAPTIAILVGLGVAISLIVGWREHVPPAIEFVKKKQIWGMLLFVFLYRSGEGFLLMEAPLFIQSSLKSGGLGLSLSQKAMVDGTVSTIVSVIAGLLGGAYVSKHGLKKVLLILALCMNIPHLCYIFLSHAVSPNAPLPLWEVYVLVSIEKFGYGFGFVGNMLYMMQQIAPGKYKMTHYAYATALMNLVLIPTQAVSGKLADWMGYRHFFIFVLVASIPSVIAAWKAPFPNPPDVDEAPEPEPAPAKAPEVGPAVSL